MSIITLDYETYYDKDYSLSKLTTEEYINHELFEVIGVGIKIDDADPVWITENIQSELSKLDWADSALLAHNTLFDGAILAWKYGIKPKFYLDTLSMARALHGPDARASLAELASRYALGEKGNDAIKAQGYHRRDFTPDHLAAYGRYCRNDCSLTHTLFHKLAKNFPDAEYDLIDITLRMFIEPQLMLDNNLLVRKSEELIEAKKVTLERVKTILKVGTPEEARKQLSSNPKFKLVLESFGVDVPMKVNSKGKQVPAFSKKDEGFIKLQESEDPVIQQLIADRLGIKSTVEQSRVDRFIGLGRRNRGFLPIPLKYYGAHTGRWSGMDAVNLQNIPTRDKDKRTLKESIIAPNGSVIINADSSQIESRILAWLAGQSDVVDAYRERRDVYSEFASKIFKRHITKFDVLERFVGKTCILGLGFGTGAEKLRHTLKTSPPGADFSHMECQRFVDVYRQNNYKIIDLWAEGTNLIKHLMSWPSNLIAIDFAQKGVIHADPRGLRLPNGLYIRYANLRIREGRAVHDSRKGPIPIWGGVLVENCVQALARNIIGEQISRIRSKLRPALTVHDSVVCVVRKEELDEAREFIETTMSTAPVWAPDLPLACEVKWGESYGDC